MRRESRHIWALVVVPGLLLLELFAVVLFTTGAGTAVAILFTITSDADLLLAVARLRLKLKLLLLPARRRATFPPGLVVGELELQLLVGLLGCAALLGLLVVTVGRREDAEGNGDSCFKIQVDCLVWARRVVSLSTLSRPETVSRRRKERFSLASSRGEKSEGGEIKRRTLPIDTDSFYVVDRDQGVMIYASRLGCEESRGGSWSEPRQATGDDV